jgi:hypothetical protein
MQRSKAIEIMGRIGLVGGFHYADHTQLRVPFSFDQAEMLSFIILGTQIHSKP